MNPTRRRVLRCLGSGAIVGLAGCAGNQIEVIDGDDRTTADTQSGADSSNPGHNPTGVLTPGETLDTGSIGRSIAVSGNGKTAVISARSDNHPNGEDSGSVYLFTKTNGSWSEATKLAAPDGEVDAYFGYSVSISKDGSVVSVGAPRDTDGTEIETGSAYVFSRTEDSWEFETKLRPVKRTEAGEFGMSVSIAADGSTLIVGGPKETNADGMRSGVAHIYVKTEDSWTERTAIAPDTGRKKEEFGENVAISNTGEIALVGAPHHYLEEQGSDMVKTKGGSGSAYIFTRSNGTWKQREQLVPEDARDGMKFGHTVSLSGGGKTAVVGAPLHNTPEINGGGAYIFEGNSNETHWQQKVKLLPRDIEVGDSFGRSVAISDDATSIVIGANADKGSNGKPEGSAYLFSLEDGELRWSQNEKLTAEMNAFKPMFGKSTAISRDGSVVLVGTQLLDEVFLFEDLG